MPSLTFHRFCFLPASQTRWTPTSSSHRDLQLPLLRPLPLLLPLLATTTTTTTTTSSSWSPCRRGTMKMDVLQHDQLTLHFLGEVLSGKRDAAVSEEAG